MIGAAVVRRLLRDPSWEVRISDQRQAPDWMREGCEVNTGDLRSLTQAREAMEGCSHVVHLAAVTGGPDYRLLEVNNALYNAVVRAGHSRSASSGVGNTSAPSYTAGEETKTNRSTS